MSCHKLVTDEEWTQFTLRFSKDSIIRSIRLGDCYNSSPYMNCYIVGYDAYAVLVEEINTSDTEWVEADIMSYSVGYVEDLLRDNLEVKLRMLDT